MSNIADIRYQYYKFLFPRPHHDLTSTTIQSTLSTHLSVKKADEKESHDAHKPTIFDIISETEKNQAKMQVPRFTQQSDVINHRLGSVGHPGVAEPLTWTQLEREMLADQKLRDSSTSKEGISTWILLSGSDQQQTSSSSPTPSAATTIAAQVEKLEIQAPPVTEPPPKRNNFRFQESYQSKVDKVGKLREALERRQGKPEKKSKPTVSSTFGTTTTTTTTTEGGDVSSTISGVTESKVRRKNPSFVQISKNNKRKQTTTTSTTTSEKPADDEMTTMVSYIQGLGSTESEEVATTTGVPFLILEPKDADFDLPQDRSPAHGSNKKTKRPSQPTKAKKKNGNKNGASIANKKNPNTKVALNKQKEKPITTKIYNYLSREVMPTVGVGLVGLVVTAGLASYFFGPLGALRRSYDDAMDRQDSGSDSIYSVNSDEYAAGNPDAGQNEEDVFGKFIAGMPANYMPKYVRYYQPHGPQPGYLQGHGQGQGQGQGQQYAGQRRVYGQQQQPAGGPKYAPQGQPGQPGQPGPQQHYFRNRNGAESPYPKVSPSPHYTSVQYQNQQPLLRNHQPQPQQPLASPFIQQLHDLQMQKSLTTNIESALKQHSFEAEADASYKTLSDDKSAGGVTVETEVITAETPAPVAPAEMSAENNGDNDAANQIQRRIAHYVVGSSIPEVRPEPERPASDATAALASPEIITATHGPRRRRSLRQRRQADDEARYIQSRSSVEAELTQIDELFKQLQEKINRLNSNQSESEKIENFDKINKEFKHTEENVNLLHLVVDHVKDIEKFQREFYIKSKNWELAMTLKTGINHIRNQILVISNLIDHPNDENLIRRIDFKENMPTDGTISPTSSLSATPQIGDGTQPINGQQQTHYSPLDDLIRIFQVKALFGLHVLQNIRPSFERAFEEVFRMPPKEKLN